MAMQKWEYVIHTFEDTVNVEKLNELGNQGWELVTLQRVDALVALIHFVFKRPRA